MKITIEINNCHECPYFDWDMDSGIPNDYYCLKLRKYLSEKKLKKTPIYYECPFLKGE